MTIETDRELLELAAKAAGIPISFSPEGLAFTPSYDDPCGRQWNPLVNDAYALRLAVALRIKFERHNRHPYVAAWGPKSFGRYEEEEGNDPCAATRRAIVRAAAAEAR